jgi:hypothetical protein
MYHGSMERDEVYVPRARSDLGIPKGVSQNHMKEYLSDAPLYTAFTLLRQQLFALQAYFFFNASGQKSYPKWTSHYNRESRHLRT